MSTIMKGDFQADESLSSMDVIISEDNDNVEGLNKT